MGCSISTKQSEYKKQVTNPDISIFPYKILLGPIIGLVTHNSARILVEFGADVEGGDVFLGYETYETEIIGTLTSITDQIDKTSTIKMKCNVAIVFKFTDLSPKTKYTFKIQKIKNQIDSSFTTLSDHLNENTFNVAFCVCNDIIAKKKLGDNNLFNNINERVKDGEINFLIHFGEQVFMDHKFRDKEGINVYQQCMDIISNKNKTLWEFSQNQIINKMKQLYRRTWSGAVAQVMANCPNLMMYDDHDIHNNFGYGKNLLDDNDPNNFVEKCARRVYYEYQRQLREDVDYINFNGVTEEYFQHILNQIGFFFLDHRGSKTWYKDPKDPSYYGNPQMENFKHCMTNVFANCPIIIIISQIPLVLFNEESTKTEKKAKEQFLKNDKENYEKFLTNFSEIKKKSNQKIILIGGDIYIGGFTDIIKNGEIIMHQVTTSGVVYETTKKEPILVEKITNQSDYLLPSGYSFKHHNWVHNRNYATLEMKMQNLTPKVIGYLTISDFNIRPYQHEIVHI